MKKTKVLIIGLFALLVTINVNAQRAGAAQRQAAAPGGECDNATLDFRIRYEYNYGGSPTNRPRSTIEVISPTSVPGNLLTTFNGQPFSSLTIAAAAFNGLTNCYTLDDITVRIDVYKKINGVDTKYKTGTKRLSDIFYYDYPIENGHRLMVVHVRLQNIQNPG